MYFIAFGLLLTSLVFLFLCIKGRYRFYRHSKVCKGTKQPKIYFGLSEVENQDSKELEGRPKDEDKRNIRSILKKHMSGRRSF